MYLFCIRRQRVLTLCLFMVISGFSACGGNPPLPTPIVGSSFAFIVTTDFQTGQYATYSMDTNQMTVLNYPIHSDATAVYDSNRGRIWVINRRGQDNVLMVNPGQGFQPTTSQWSTGAGSNPYDMEFISPDYAYISRYDRPELLKMNLTNGATMKEIDLSPFADADGLPEMSYMLLHDNRLFIAIQRLDRNNLYTPAGNGLLAVVDATTDTLVDVNPSTPEPDAIPLQGKNPCAGTDLLFQDGLLYVADTGEYGVLDGGIEVVNPVNLSSRGFLITEEALGGDLLDFALQPGKGYAILSDSSFKTLLVSFNPITKMVEQTLLVSEGFHLARIALAPGGDKLFVLDRNPSAPGLRILRTNNDQWETSAPLSTGLPPFWLAWVILPI